MKDKNYISHIAETKVQYHIARGKMPYEDKIKIIIELQKIAVELRKNNKKRISGNEFCMVWNIPE